MKKYLFAISFLLLSSTIFANDFTITDPNLIFYKLLENSKTVKSDFETTEQYNNRIKNMPVASNTLYFDVKRNFSYKYDADKKQLSIIAGDVWINKSNNINIVFNSECELAKSYIATNGFGAQIKIEKWDYTKYLLMVSRSKSIENIIDSSNKCFKIVLPFPPDENRVKNIKIIAEFKNIHNVKMKCKDSEKATFTNPEESSEFIYYGKATLSRLLVWDSISKSVIKEFII